MKIRNTLLVAILLALAAAGCNPGTDQNTPNSDTNSIPMNTNNLPAGTNGHN